MFDDDDDDFGEGAMDERMNVRKTPIFKKAEEIRELAIAIVEAAPDSIAKDEDRSVAMSGLLEATKRDMEEYAYTITGKLAGAMGLGLYDLQMENAALIRRSCRELVTCLRGLEMAGHVEEGHFNLLRQAVQEFRPLFVEWVATFKDSDHLWDDWGLFNPPGAIPDED